LQNGLQDELTVRITDKIYHQAFEYFKVCNIVLLIYAGGKMVATPYYALTADLSHLTLFLLALFITSVIQLLTCRLTIQTLKNPNLYYEIADITNHSQEVPRRDLSESILNADYRLSQTYDYTEPAFQDEDERRMKMLSLEIRYLLHQSN
jgi:hypothetical protein